MTEAPISYRPGKERAARLAKFGEKHGLRPAEVLHQLIDAGLEAEGEGSTPFRKIKAGLEDAIAGRGKVVAVRKRTWSLSVVPLGGAPVPIGSRLKGAKK